MYTDKEMWRDIRRKIFVDGESKRSICREYGIHFRTLQKILTHTIPPGYQQTQPREKRKIGPYLAFIEEILTEDRKAPRKQRHSAKRIFDRFGTPAPPSQPLQRSDRLSPQPYRK